VNTIQISFTLILTLSLTFLIACQGQTDENTVTFSDDNWWPEQPVPNVLVTAKQGDTHGEDALLHSIAGLVAKAQKKGDLDELVWIETGGMYTQWYSKLVNRIGAEEQGVFDVWQLLDRYQDEGIIDGYILYNPEYDDNLRPDMDFSYNIAVSYAGVENAIVIDESLESEIQDRGYSMILDAREISRDDYFEDLKDRINRDLIVTMDPVAHNNMDLAIANNAIVTYGTDEVTERMMEWTNPISPVVGWNTGGEDVFTGQAAEYGLFITATDHNRNLLALSAGAGEAEYQKVKSVDPQTIDFNMQGHFHSFVLSDGDNMQWTIGSFLGSEDFWANSAHGDFPVGFSYPPINQSMMSPDVLDEMSRTTPEQTTVMEYGPGGYLYPDKFAIRRENQEEIQREFARILNRHMQRTGTTVIGFIGIDIRSQESIDAYEIYAEEIENLTGMFGVEYEPYHGGEGDIIWVQNRQGHEIPVITARYSLWADHGYDHRGGEVGMVADAINQDAVNEEQVMDWTIVHAWSYFENPSDPNEVERGLYPMKWTINHLNDDIHIVSPEELLWRVRMKNNQQQTMDAIAN